MTRHLFTFLATFAIGAVAAFATRAALHQPDTEVTAHTAAEHAAMVSNPLTSQKPAAPATPAKPEGRPAAAPVKASPTSGHEGHAMATPAAKADGPVNTVCAICGMPVDPTLPTMEYQGKKIGFGCKICPPKFKAEPDKYGPYYLRNEVMKK